MKKLIIMIGCVLLTCMPNVHARNDFKEFSIESAFNLDAYKNKLGDDIKFYFGKKHRGRVVKTHGTWPTQKKTNAFNKTDEYACQWALLSALLSLKKRAKSEGGNAVINIKTNNDHNERSSSETFQCEVGNIIASVALVGTVVTLD
ncbi:hypothetical protein NBRC116583_07440 [Arenicella sp. 4NH20-0111]|uniref:excinuclease n=1 Tax=Arenicella sp. 4NH20-0111 TaxID=3127648 RepID=UPI0031028917